MQVDPCCSKCNKFIKYPGKDFCCLTCRDTGGKSHGQSCQQIPCSTAIISVSQCCPKCDTYKKYPGADFCCRTCRDTGGQSHGQSCQRIPCFTVEKQKQQPQVANCCSKCNTYTKYPGFDFCCRTCRDTGGQSHGQSCQKIPCMSQQQKQQITTTNCNNLLTGQPLFNPNTTICFYEANEPYYEFTNFYMRTIKIDGKDYPTTEHYFQSQKFLPAYPNIAEQIRLTARPREAFDIAQKNSQLIRPDWHTGYKDKIMLQAVEAKFTQHKDLKDLLLSTDTKTLVEHTKNDKTWGSGGDGTGENRLGKLLMQVRNNLRLGILKGGNTHNYQQLFHKYKQRYLDLKAGYQ
ncbi:MAG: hypothetical protein Barrevirus18_4 [Barrevirus sp.]|uniref:NADAR domain-containing protein n=1 Tax=Barrevirus sp. TaxID=2487763 RepID=A0A3G4ZQL0_9VIRU|nr:MAG: hypothetical protein Barrevirus18_4 [Barrevirus sp.]